MDASMLTILSMGAIFGLTAGISPGPLLTLVITETLKHNRAAGIRVALSPLITDLPIILATYFIFSQLSGFGVVIGIISILGGLFFAWLGFETVKTKRLNTGDSGKRPDSLKKGVTANFLNPNPYIFWFTAGIPTAFKAYKTGLAAVILYFLLFYTALIGSKVIVAFLVERSRHHLDNKIYRVVMQALGLVLFGFALYFLGDGIRLLIK